MDESILNSIKKLLGLEETYNAFDADILMHINTVIMILRQLGIGPSTGFELTNANQTWSDYLGEEVIKYAGIKTYIYLKVRLMFDPPSGAVAEATNNLISELEWRLNVEYDYPED